MGLEDEEADHLARIFLQNVLDREEVILRLRHFLVVDGDKAIVEPIARKFHVSVDAWIRLCDLILMMREDQITAAAVEVKRLTEILHRHRRALDVPARASFPPRAVPRGLARLCRLPQSEVHRMMLRLVDLDARTCLHVIKTASAEASVRSKCLNAVVDVACLRNVGIAALDQRLDHVDDVVHRLGDARKYISTMHIQRIHRRKVGGDIAVRDLLPRHALAVRRIDDLIVHVGEVLDVAHAIALVCEIAPNDIPRHKGSCISDVRVIIGSDTAAVNADLALTQRVKFFLFTGHCIVNSNHRISLFMLFKDIQPRLQCGDLLTHLFDRLRLGIGQHVMIEVDIQLTRDLLGTLLTVHGVGTRPQQLCLCTDALPLHHDNASWDADHGGMCGNGSQDDRARTDLGMVAHRERAKYFRARCHDDVVAERRMSLSFFFARSAEGHPLVERDVSPDLRRLTDDNTCPVVDKESLADGRSRMDLNPRQEAPEVRDQARDQHPAAHKKCVGDTVQPDGMQPAVAEHHLDHALRRRVTLKNDANVAPDLCEHERILSVMKHKKQHG